MSTAITSHARPPLFDCDINLTIFEKFNLSIPRELALAAEKSNLACAIVPGSNLEDSLAALSIARDQNLFAQTNVQLYSTFGLHPYCANGNLEQEREAFSQALRKAIGEENGVVVALGECGLDASPGFPPMQQQLDWFRLQLDLACELQCPLFLHERGAHASLLSELQVRKHLLPQSNKILIHCFTGNAQELEAYLDFGCLISISGLVCREDKEGKRFRQVLQQVQPPSHRILLETDAPYMQFPGCRQHCDERAGEMRPNVPSSIAQVARAVATCLQRDLVSVQRDTFQASKAFFNI